MDYGVNGFYQKYNQTALAASFTDSSTGGTAITSFTTVETTSWTAPTGVTSVDYLVVAGGGGGGGGGSSGDTSGAGGGGAGGVRTGTLSVTPGTSYTVTVGDGGSGANMNTHARGVNGDDSVFGSITSTGGGGGGTAANASNIGNRTGADGGSGGGGSSYGASTYDGGSGTTDQGYDGGQGGGTNTGGGGGGGASEAGDTGAACSDGGDGVASSISGSSVTYGGGGGGGQHYNSACARGDGGSGGGGMGGAKQTDNATAGTANTGGGGGGGGGNYYTSTANGKAGGSGIVIISYEDPALARHTITANGDAANQRPQPHGITANGNASMLGPKQGTSLITFDGDGDYLSMADSSDWDFGTGDFTLEGWVNFDGSQPQVLWFNYTDYDAGNEDYMVFRVHTTGAAKFDLVTGGSGVAYGDFGQLPVNTWCHVAYVRQGTGLKCYVNGVAQDVAGGSSGTSNSTTLTVPSDFVDYSNGVWIGRWGTNGTDTGTGRYSKGYVDSIRVSNSARYTIDFSAPTTAFSNDGNTLLLIQSGTDGSQTFTDSSSNSHTITANGGVRWLAPKIGAGAIALDGSGDYLSTASSSDFSFGSGDFTLEGWVKLNSTGDQYFLSSHGSVAASREFYFGLESSTLMFYYYYGSSSESSVSSSWTPSANTWYHVAVCRNGADLRLFVDGSQLGSTHDISTRYLHNNVYDLLVGALTNTGGSITGSVDGYMDEVRISSTARYTTTFTPSTTEFTDDINTALIIHGDQKEGTGFQDKSTGLAISENSRMFFDGTGDYLRINSSSDFEVAASNSESFTLECWVKLDLHDDQETFMSLSDSGATLWRFRNYHGNGVSFQVYDSGSLIVDVSGAEIADTAWHHVALVKVGNGSDSTYTLYKDGTSIGTTTDSSEFTVGGGLDIGCANTAGDPLQGYMDEIRISNSARYTSTFTPETRGEQFTADANTKLLIHSDWEGGLGADSSGNYNTFTATNLVATDVVKDSPSNNFCTFNPLNGKSEIVDELEEGNLRVGDGGGSAVSGWNLFSTFAVSSGKWYYEYRDTSPSTRNSGVGWCDVNMDVTGGGSGALDVVGAFWYNNLLYEQGSSAAIGETLDTNVIAGVAIDVDAGKVWFSHNGTWWDSQDPAAGSNPKFTAGTNPTTWMPMFQNGNDGSGTVNYGQDSSFAGAVTAQNNADDNGLGSFFYSPPSGFLALCSENLPSPEIADPTAHFNTVAYSGDGTSPRTIDVGLQPDLTWLKIRTQAYSHRLFDSIRGADEALFANGDAAEAAGTSGYLSGFTSTGPTFTANGSDERDVNESGDTYVVWNWKGGGAASTNDDGSIDSEVSANTTAGFSVVSWTGTGSNVTVGHGLAQAPELVINKSRDDVYNWAIQSFLWNSASDTNMLYLNTDAAQADDTNVFQAAPTSTVFSPQGGSWAGIGANTIKYIAYCFHSVEGYSKIGSYTGTGGADGAFVYTGFRPAYVLQKVYSASSNWLVFDNKRTTYNVVNKYLTVDTNAAESEETVMDFTSNGFKFRATSASFNASQSYIYLAFAETPFKTANAR